MVAARYSNGAAIRFKVIYRFGADIICSGADVFKEDPTLCVSCGGVRKTCIIIRIEEDFLVSEWTTAKGISCSDLDAIIAAGGVRYINGVVLWC